MKFKRVMTYSPREKKVRICRILWDKEPKMYFRKSLSVNLWPRLFRFWRENGTDWFFALFGLQLHFKSASYGAFPD